MDGRLKQFNALCLVKSLIDSWLTDLSNEKFDDTPPYKHLFEAAGLAKDEVHRLFIKISELGLLLAQQPAAEDIAQLILLKLFHALREHPDLFDSRKICALQDVAYFFQKIGEQFYFESIIESIRCIDAEPDPSLIVNTKVVLRGSYLATSSKASEALSKIWQKKYGATGVPLNCFITSSQRALHKPGLMMTQSFIDPPSGDFGFNILGQHDMHIAASLGAEDLIEHCIAGGASIDARDLFQRTPLMMAVVRRQESCCRLLIKKNCDVSLRDSKFRSILELAGDAGSPEIVRILLQAEAEVNPQVVKGNSTPLQVAICSNNFNEDLVILLLDHGARVFEARSCDGKTAIDLAKERQHHELALTMAQKYAWTGPAAFPGFNFGS